MGLQGNHYYPASTEYGIGDMLMEYMVGNDEEANRTIISRPGAVPRAKVADFAHYIVVVAGPEAGKMLEIGLEPVKLGRHHDNALILADPCVSSHHCSVAFSAGQLWVTDMGSTNGSFIDGERITGRAPWPISASLQLGSQVLRHEFRQRMELRHASELAEDLSRAATYVQTLLPAKQATGPVTADWHFLPSAELGGDIFDYYWLNPATFVFYLLDVSGHGIGAALHSVAVFNVLRQRSLPGVQFDRPVEVLDALNKAFPMERYGSMYFTLWYGVFHADTGRLDFASAGHPPALLFDTQSDIPIPLATDSPPIGVLEDCNFLEDSWQVAKPAKLYLYSDGVYEIVTRRGDFLPWNRFVQLLTQGAQNGAAEPDSIYRRISEMAEGGRFEDDFSIVLFGF